MESVHAAKAFIVHQKDANPEEYFYTNRYGSTTSTQGRVRFGKR